MKTFFRFISKIKPSDQKAKKKLEKYTSIEEHAQPYLFFFLKKANSCHLNYLQDIYIPLIIIYLGLDKKIILSFSILIYKKFE